MAATIEIISQSNPEALMAAYRPIQFQVFAVTSLGAYPAVVYCDIYINEVYYKSLSKTGYIMQNGNPVYYFDIQDALQELLTYSLPEMDGSVVETPDKSFRKVFVKFRTGALDADGFIYSEQLAPVQQSSTDPAQPGDGMQSNVFYVLNATIQHEEKQDLETFLRSYQTGIWAAESMPLTKRPKVMKLCKKDSSFFPMLSFIQPKRLCLNYTMRDGITGTVCVDIPSSEITCAPPTLLSVEAIDSDLYRVYFNEEANQQGIVSVQSSIDGGSTWFECGFTDSAGFANYSNSNLNGGVSHFARVKRSCINAAESDYSAPILYSAPIVCAPLVIANIITSYDEGSGFDLVSGRYYSFEFVDDGAGTNILAYQASIDGGITWDDCYGFNGPGLPPNCYGREFISDTSVSPTGAVNHLFRVQRMCGNGAISFSDPFEFTVNADPSQVDWTMKVRKQGAFLKCIITAHASGVFFVNDIAQSRITADSIYVGIASEEYIEEFGFWAIVLTSNNIPITYPMVISEATIRLTNPNGSFVDFQLPISETFTEAQILAETERAISMTY